VFYDENANGSLDEGEVSRVPNVEVSVGGRTARSETLTGRFTVDGVPAGPQTVAVRGETLPPFFVAGPPLSVQVPQAAGAEARLPLTLPIGGNKPNVYMAFGDSITLGETASPGATYPAVLQSRLTSHFAYAVVNNRGADGTNSFEGVERARRNLRGSEPACTLILYGTNDWNILSCQLGQECQTVENLRAIVREVKAFRSLPFISTIVPVNPEMNPSERNDWVRGINAGIRTMATEEGAFLVDAHASFERRGNLASLFADHVHPNDQGYALIADAFFQAIAFGRHVPEASAFGPPGPVLAR
jgi:lysophospholipase L1-like esterase